MPGTRERVSVVGRLKIALRAMGEKWERNGIFSAAWVVLKPDNNTWPCLRLQWFDGGLW
jgi:hypothetical protein